MLYIRLNILNGIRIKGIWKVLMALHFRFQSDWNINLFVDRSIVFHDNWLFQIYLPSLFITPRQFTSPNHIIHPYSIIHDQSPHSLIAHLNPRHLSCPPPPGWRIFTSPTLTPQTSLSLHHPHPGHIHHESIISEPRITLCYIQVDAC